MKEFKTSIGGQAVIEGVMMRGPKMTALAVRMMDQSIDVEMWVTGNKKWYAGIPFVRGIFHMIHSLQFGHKCLMLSAEKSGMDEEEPSKLERWLAEKFQKDITSIISGVAVLLGSALAIGLFIVLPTFIAGLFTQFGAITAYRALLEGVLKIAMFVIYLALVSRIKDIRRVFEYHGAEHKTISCYEAGQELTVANVRKMPRFHPRCGTSFLLIVMIVSIALFSVINISSIPMRILLKLLLLPVVVGIAYEFIKLVGRHNNWFTWLLSSPGLWLQRLTTQEPDDAQIEVAIASMQPVLPMERGTDIW